MSWGPWLCSAFCQLFPVCGQGSATYNSSLHKSVGEGLTLTLSLGLGSRVEVREMPRDWRPKG